jgi:iron complex outermembrane receptor protein
MEKRDIMTSFRGLRHSTTKKALFVSSSILPLLAIAMPAAAQSTTIATDPPAQTAPVDAVRTGAAVETADAATDGEIVVTGIRRSLGTAQATKFGSDQFVDSITATDIGKLPDRNVAEALQRISGIQITRRYGEGSGIAIRGLTQVKTELNGRDVFGGSSGRALGFEDVPSELLAGVDVYKNPSASEIEGGIGGLVNLRTRMPFDEKGFVVSASMGANYFDLAKDARFNGSVLASKTWSGTPIGDFGILADLSYYEGAIRRDQATIDPYVDATNVPGHIGETMSVPDGAGISVTQGGRKRKGLYVAAQWEPAANLQFYGTFFRSQYDIRTPNYSSFVTNGTSADGVNYMQPNAADSFSFKPDGTFASGGFNGFVPPYSQPPYVNTGMNVANATQVANSRTVTTEYAGGVKWEPAHNLHVDLDLQYERATASVQSYTAFAQHDLAGYAIDLTGDLPGITFQGAPGSGSIYDLAQYRLTALMDHQEASVATQKAARLDVRWNFDGGLLTSIRGGARYTDRDAVNRSTPYNYTGATTTLTLDDPATFGAAAPYGSLFGGDGAGIVGPVPFVNAGLFNDPAGAFRTFTNRGLSPFGPQDVNTQREKTYAGYLSAYFTFQAGLPIDGSFAVRVVKTSNSASGSTRITYRPDLLPTTEIVTDDQPFGADQSYTKVLPSFNAQAHITERLQLRGAVSKGLSRPDFGQLTAVRSFSVGYNQTTVQNADYSTTVTGYVPNGVNTGNAGNPLLKPLTTDQADLALEWNASRTTFVYGTVFYKKLKNFIQGVTSTVAIDVPGQGTQSFLTTTNLNGSKGEIKGVELGGNTFFDFLPGPLAGLGAQANVTYVDSSAPGATGILPNGRIVPTELQGLSKWSYNLVGLYEKYGVSARAAYNWRGSYLADSAGNGTGGIPIYNRAYGQLDASLSYDFNPKVSVTIDATNLLKARYDSYQYYPQNPRNYELNDRRFGLTFRMRN